MDKTNVEPGWQSVTSWCHFFSGPLWRGSAGASLRQGRWGHLSSPAYIVAVLSASVFSPRKVGLTWTRTCLELSESFINRPALGREHLCFSIAFLGWAPKLPDSWTITCSFRVVLYIYFTEPMSLLSPQIHLENMVVSCQSRGSKL